jgi:hypothetical protein
MGHVTRINDVCQTMTNDASRHIRPSLFLTLTRTRCLWDSFSSAASRNISMYPDSVTVASACPRPRDKEKLPVVTYPMTSSCRGVISPS